jgi:hypothetical protein
MTPELPLGEIGVAAVSQRPASCPYADESTNGPGQGDDARNHEAGDKESDRTDQRENDADRDDSQQDLDSL